MRNIIKLISLAIIITCCLSLPVFAGGGGGHGEKNLDYRFILTQGSQPDSRYIPFSGLGNRRWQDGIVRWWYNPENQAFTTDEAVTAIKEAAASWERVSGLRFIYQGITSQALSNRSDDRFVIGWLDGATFRNRFGNYAGYTYIWWNGNYIFDSEISLNAGDSAMQVINSFKGIVTHEFGHVIGLDHSDVPESVMFANPYHSAEYQAILRDDDILAASTLYPGGEVPNTPDGTMTLQEKADALFLAIENSLQQYFSPSAATQTLYTGNDPTYFRIYNNVNSTALAVTEQGLWYMIWGQVYFFDTLDNSNTILCNGSCFPASTVPEYPSTVSGLLYNSNDGSCSFSGHSIDFYINGSHAITVGPGQNESYALAPGTYLFEAKSSSNKELIYSSDFEISNDGWWYWSGCSNGTHP